MAETENQLPPRVSVNYRRGKSLDIGCVQQDCQYPAGSLAIRPNGDVVYETHTEHGGKWHTNGKSLREMITILATHDLNALKELLGPDLIQKLHNLNSPSVTQWGGINRSR